MKNRLKKKHGLLGFAIVASVALVLSVNVAYVDLYWIDVNTGSQKGGRHWRFGLVSDQWYNESGLESFLRHDDSIAFDQHWVSKSGYGRTIFGRTKYRSHGSPGAITALLPDWIDFYCQIATDAEKAELYNALRSRKTERILEMVGKVTDSVTTNIAKNRGLLPNGAN